MTSGQRRGVAQTIMQPQGDHGRAVRRPGHRRLVSGEADHAAESSKRTRESAGIAVAVNPASNTTGASDGNEVLYSENAFANAGVLVVQEMVKTWWVEACRGFTMADVMVEMEGHGMIYQLVN